MAMAAFLWTQKQDMGPPARGSHGMAYDSARGRTVLFGGEILTGPATNDTWEWDGSLWTQMANFGPSVRHGHAMAYDAAHRQTVVFGGTGASLFGDTWAWDGADWTQLADSGPPGRVRPSATYDSARQRVVVFGGDGLAAGTLGDTWEWDGLDWTQVAETGPTPRSDAAMTFDSVRNKSVLFGGIGAGAAGVLGDTWEWDGINWTRSADFGARPCVRAAMVFATNRSILFGGSDSSRSPPPPNFFGTTWEWDGHHWVLRQDMGPGRRWSHAMAFDSKRGSIVLFGGLSDLSSGPLGDTWEHAMEPGGGPGGTPSIANLTLQPPQIKFEEPSALTVTLDGPAAEQTVIMITASDPVIVGVGPVSLPLALPVAPGFVTASLVLTCSGQPIGPDRQVAIKAELNGTSKTVLAQLVSQLP